MDSRAYDSTMDQIVAALSNARRVLFVTGAGLSADSGLPTYRGIGGLYQGMATPDGLAIETVLSGEMFRRDPELTWKYLLEMERACRGARYNAAHRVIAQFETMFEHVVILTQNVDGLHQRAGSTRVIDIHGDLHELRCVRCSKRRSVVSYAGLNGVPRCPCGGVERPEVVLFGEELPEAKYQTFLSELGRGFDFVFSIGTGGTFPYVRLPMIRAKSFDCPSADINPERNAMTDYARYHLPLRAAEACEALWQRLARRR